MTKKKPSVPNTRIGRAVETLGRVRPAWRIGAIAILVVPAATLVSVRMILPEREAIAQDFGNADNTKCVIQMFPAVGESTQAAMGWWAKIWSTYMCAFQTMQSGVVKATDFWNANATRFNETMGNIEATKNALASLRESNDILKRQRDQVRSVTNNLIIRNKDFTKIRISTLDASELVVLKDMGKANFKVESLATSLGLQNDKTKEQWMESNEGRALLGAIKARNDIVFEQTKLRAVEKELRDAERAAKAVSLNDKDGPDPFEVYQRLSFPTMQKLSVIQTQISLLQTEISLRTYEAIALKKPIDKNPMGKSATEYYDKRLRELGAAY